MLYLILRSIKRVAPGVSPGRGVRIGARLGRRVDVPLVLAHVEVHALILLKLVAHTCTINDRFIDYRVSATNSKSK